MPITSILKNILEEQALPPQEPMLLMTILYFFKNMKFTLDWWKMIQSISVKPYNVLLSKVDSDHEWRDEVHEI